MLDLRRGALVALVGLVLGAAACGAGAKSAPDARVATGDAALDVTDGASASAGDADTASDVGVSIDVATDTATDTTKDGNGDEDTGSSVVDAQGDRDAATEHAGDAASDSARDGPCDVGCRPTTQGAFCQAGETQWLCQGGGTIDYASFQAACRMAPTDSIRWCCPPSYLSMCQ